MLLEFLKKLKTTVFLRFEPIGKLLEIMDGKL